MGAPSAGYFKIDQSETSGRTTHLEMKRQQECFGPKVEVCQERIACRLLPHQRTPSVATKLRCPSLSKVKMSVGGFAGSVSRRREDYPIGAVPASARSLRLQFGGLGHSQGTVLQEPGSLA